MTTLTIDVPDNLAKEARDAGLLAPEVIAGILRDTLRRKRADQLFEAADELAAADLPPMTMDEIQAEVKAVRAKRRRRTPGY